MHNVWLGSKRWTRSQELISICRDLRLASPIRIVFRPISGVFPLAATPLTIMPTLADAKPHVILTVNEEAMPPRDRAVAGGLNIVVIPLRLQFRGKHTLR